MNWSPVQLAQHAVDLVEEPGGALGLGQVQPLGLGLDLAQLLQVLLVVLGGFNWIKWNVWVGSMQKLGAIDRIQAGRSSYQGSVEAI